VATFAVLLSLGAYPVSRRLLEGRLACAAAHARQNARAEVS
jgi:hypothetical protein